MGSFLKENWYFLLFAIVALIITLKIIFQKRKESREREEQYQKKLKDQVLNEALKNSMAKHNSFAQTSQAAPVEQENPNNRQISVEQGLIMMRLVVTGERKESFVLSPKDGILLGRAKNNNIVLSNEFVANHQCEIFMYQGHTYVRNLCLDNQIILRRKSQQTLVGKNGVQLQTGDQLMIGYYGIQVAFTDYVGKEIQG